MNKLDGSNPSKGRPTTTRRPLSANNASGEALSRIPIRDGVLGQDGSAGSRSRIYANLSPAAFEVWLSELVKQAKISHPPSRQFVFLNAWNEWGEGTHLEPDNKYGRQWLDACARGLRCDGPPATIASLKCRFFNRPNPRVQLCLELIDAYKFAEALECVQ